MNLLAKVIQLDNAGKPDEEVILICDDFYELRNLLRDPAAYLRGVGIVHFSDFNWTLNSPVTAIIVQDDHSIAESVIPTLGEAFSKYESAAAFTNSNGGFVASFAKKTHTLYIRYKEPTTVEDPNPDISFTIPAQIKTSATEGTVHFDLNVVKNPTGDPKKDLNFLRASFVVDHLVKPDENTWNRLSKRPKQSDATNALAPGANARVELGGQIPQDVTFKQGNSGRNFVVVEGLSKDDSGGETVVCTQAGMQFVSNPPPGHWELNGFVVKNYEEG